MARSISFFRHYLVYSCHSPITPLPLKKSYHVQPLQIILVNLFIYLHKLLCEKCLVSVILKNVINTSNVVRVLKSLLCVVTDARRFDENWSILHALSEKRIFFWTWILLSKVFHTSLFHRGFLRCWWKFGISESDRTWNIFWECFGLNLKLEKNCSEVLVVSVNLYSRRKVSLREG